MDNPEKHTEQGFAIVSQILGLIADPAAHAARLQELDAKTGEVRGLIEQAATATADLDAKSEAHADRIKSETADHEQRMAVERAAFDADHARREKALQLREAEIDRLHDQATVDAEAAANLKADLQHRSTAMREIVRQAGSVVNAPAH